MKKRILLQLKENLKELLHRLEKGRERLRLGKLRSGRRSAGAGNKGYGLRIKIIRLFHIAYMS